MVIVKVHSADEAQRKELSFTQAPLAVRSDMASSSDTMSDYSTPQFDLPTTTQSFGESVVDQIIGSYVTLKGQGLYTPELGVEMGKTIASGIRADLSYKQYAASSFNVTQDTSFDRALQYQREIQAALTPVQEKTEPEYVIFATYVETKEPLHLTRLRAAAASYAQAASSTALLTVPADALQAHAMLTNALGRFSAALTALANFADDPVASTALLPSYNEAENDVIEALNALNSYYANKHR